jgi:hypothetical protein
LTVSFGDRSPRAQHQATSLPVIPGVNFEGRERLKLAALDLSKATAI